MRSSPSSQIALARSVPHSALLSVAPPPPRLGGSSVVAPPPPGAATDFFSDADADDIYARIRGVDWSTEKLPIDLPDPCFVELPPARFPFDVTPGPFAPEPPRRHVDLLLAFALIFIASLASVALGLGLGWLAATLN
ncbi:MAG: hypothetical protein V7704_20760 [Aurantimonas endophytica]|uniref:hypothetical protein n=1 Tax=Aurantimonas endophytica TaxID=1522175 RepID=UPI003001BB34